MNLSKLHEAVKEFEAEAARFLQLADDVKAVIKRSMNGSSTPDSGLDKKPRLNLKHREDAKKSFLILAVDTLRSSQGPMHISELVEKVAEKRSEATRSQVESALVRGMKAGKFKGVIKRTSPGTFSASQ